MGSSQRPLFTIEEGKTLKHRNRKNYNQYFTPEFAVEKALSFVPMAEVKTIIDPAVGDGIFLKIASKKWIGAKLFGIDIDASAAEKLKVIDLPNSTYFTGDSLLKETWEPPELKEIISNGGFDLVVGNPPFSSWFQRIKARKILINYRLAQRNDKLMRGQAIEVLFIEIFVRIAREGGYIVVVLPDGILSNPQYRYVREFILTETKIRHIINLPRGVFQDTSAKTSILILEKKRTDDLNYLVKIYNLKKTGFINNTIEVKGKDLINRMDYWYYDNLKRSSINDLINNGLEFVPLRKFVVYCKTGKTLYGKERKFSDKGLRFLHATNITETGINYKKDEKFIDPSTKMNFPNAHVRVGDILFVRVGVGCAGRVAIVDTKEDEGAATDYIHIFRVKDISPYFLVVYLKTRFGMDSINLLKHGVGTVSINKTDLLSLPIPIVPQTLQREVEEKYKHILSKYREDLNDVSIKKDMDVLLFSLEKEIENLRMR
ncbi:MAG: N-6 DNA methylase [Candidatus Bathyarchaeia archaeon]